MMTRRFHLMLGILILALITACGGGAGGGGGGGGGATPGPALPTASFAVSPDTTTYVSETLTFDPTSSAAASDADPIATYTWDFADGTTLVRDSDSPVTHTYTSAGTYTVELEVSSEQNLTATATQTITVGTGAPDVTIDNISPDPGLVGETVTFDASDSSPTGATINERSWNFGDGQSGSGSSVTHTYSVPSTPGTYEVSFTAEDDVGRQGQAVSELRVHQRPVADAGPDRGVNIGGTLTFDGTASFDPDPDGSISSYEWDFDHNGTFSADETGGTVTHTFEDTTYDAGSTYYVALRVADNDGAESLFVVVAVDVLAAGANLPPIADTGGPYDAVLSEETITFDGSASADPDGSINTYEWDFDYDGTFAADASTAEADYSYATSGEYNVALRVTDDEGEASLDTTTVVVHSEPVAAVAQTSGPAGHGLVDAEIDFSGAASTSGTSGDDAADYVASYEWNFGDGSAPVTTSVPTVSHGFSAAGSYTVELTVTDSFGVSSTPQTFAIQVYEQPVADVGGPYGPNDDNVFNPGDSVVLDAGSSFVPATLVATYEWDYRYDGVAFAEPPDGIGETHTDTAPDTPGTYTLALRLTVREPGASDPPLAVLIDTRPYRINAQPVADFEWTADEAYVDSGVVQGPICGAEVAFDNDSGDPDGSVVEYAWDFGDGTTSTEEEPSVTFDCAGATGGSQTYSVQLQITDNDGGTDSITYEIDVYERGSVDGTID